MAFIITFQPPKEYEGLLERYEAPNQSTNIDFVLQGESDFGEWTVNKNCKPGDIVFFRCAASSANHMRRLNTEARRHGNPGVIEYAEKEQALYRQYAGQILAVGEVADYPAQQDSGWEHPDWRSRWYAKITAFRLLEAPIAFEVYRGFIKVSTWGSITQLDESQEKQLLDLIAANNPGLGTKPRAEEIFDESKDIAERISTEIRRNREARMLCIEKKGTTCVVCGFNSMKRYGVEGIIHVHHVNPLLELNPGETTTVDPMTDLEPVCPNCHALIHSKGKQEWYTIEEAREMVRRRGDEIPSKL